MATFKKGIGHRNHTSNHVALSDFNFGVTPSAGSSTELSLNPLLEWHSFANVPYPGKEAYVESGGEAIICISNKKVTWDLVY